MRENNNIPNNNLPNNNLPHTSWESEHETILVEWGDKAMCFRWMHSKAHSLFSIQNAWFTIPVIIISTCTGAANFAQDRFNPDYKDYIVMVVGSLNIIAGIITTIQQFLKITQLNEAHRVSSIAWGKFHRNIKIELTKRPNERMNVNNMLKISKEEYDRLIETSPTIPESIIIEFNKTFPIEENNCNAGIEKNYNQKSIASNVIRPEICDILNSTNDYRFKGEESNETEILETKIKDYISSFLALHGRTPEKNEILEYLGGIETNSVELLSIVDKCYTNLHTSELEIDIHNQ